MVTFLDLPVSRLDDDDNTTAAFRVPNITTENQAGAIEEYVSMLIGTVLTDGLARNSQSLYPVLAANVKNGMGEATAFQACLIPVTTCKANMTTLPFSVRIKLARYGYRYEILNSTTWVAVVVLLVCVLMVIDHMSIVITELVTGKYCGGESWENVADLMALAVNSAPGNRLYGTSAGIGSFDTWDNVVKIREMDGEHLELCSVAKGQEDRRMVEVGTMYLERRTRRPKMGVDFDFGRVELMSSESMEWRRVRLM